MFPLTAIPLHIPGSAPTTDAHSAARLTTAGKAAIVFQRQLADRSGDRGTQIRRYQAGTRQPTPDVALNHPRALNASTGDNDARRSATPNSRLMFEALEHLGRDERTSLIAFVEGELLRHDARGRLAGQAS